jgi:hypothetical protein
MVSRKTTNFNSRFRPKNRCFPKTSIFYVCSAKKCHRCPWMHETNHATFHYILYLKHVSKCLDKGSSINDVTATGRWYRLRWHYARIFSVKRDNEVKLVKNHRRDLIGICILDFSWFVAQHFTSRQSGSYSCSASQTGWHGIVLKELLMTTMLLSSDSS